MSFRDVVFYIVQIESISCNLSQSANQPSPCPSGVNNQTQRGSYGADEDESMDPLCAPAASW